MCEICFSLTVVIPSIDCSKPLLSSESVNSRSPVIIFLLCVERSIVALMLRCVRHKVTQKRSGHTVDRTAFNFGLFESSLLLI